MWVTELDKKKQALITLGLEGRAREMAMQLHVEDLDSNGVLIAQHDIGMMISIPEEGKRLRI